MPIEPIRLKNIELPEAEPIEPVSLQNPEFDQNTQGQEQEKPLPKVSIQPLSDDFDLPDVELEPVQLKAAKEFKTPELPPPSLPAAPKPPQEESKFKGNVIGNFLDNSWRIVKGIADLAFVSTPTHLHDLAADPEKYSSDVAKWWREHGEALPGQLWDTTFGRYFKGDVEDALAEIWNNPADFLLDLTLVSGVAANATGKIGQIAKSERLINYGKNLSNLSHAVDPIVMSSRLVGKVAKPVLEAMGVGTHTKPLLALRDGEYSAETLEKVKNLQKVISEDLPDVDAKALDRAIRVGAEEDIRALSPKAADRYKAWREVVGDEERTFKGRDLLEQKQMDLANAKAAAIYLDGDIEKALALMKEGKIRPTFASMFRPAEAGVDVFEALTSDLRRSIGKVNRLEKRVGAEAFERDPRVYMVRQVNLYHEMNKRLRWLDRIKEYLGKRGELKILRKGEDPPAGYALLPEGIYRKYYENTARAASATVDDIMRGADPIRAAEGVAKKLIDDPTMALAAKDELHIAVPRHVAALVAREFRIQGALSRVYTKGLNYWKSMATVFRPSYWIGQALGDGFLGILAGATPADWIRGRALRDALPANLRTSLSVGEMAGLGRFERVVQNLHDYASVMDQQLRRTLYAKGVEKARLRLLDAGDSFFQAMKSIRDPGEFGRIVSMAPDELSTLVAKVQRAQEDIARSIPEILTLRKQLAAAGKRADQVGEEYGKLLEQEVQGGTTFREKQIRTKISALEEDAAKIVAGQPAAAEGATAAIKEIRKGKQGLRKQLATMMRRQITASVSDLSDVLTDIKKRGGVNLTTPTQRPLPKGLKGKGGAGIQSDVLAQEFADRGIISEASQDALLDYLERAESAVQNAKVALGGVKGQAKTAASGKLNEAIVSLIQNTSERVKLKRELRDITREKAVGQKALGAISAERKAKIAAKEKELQEIQAQTAAIENSIKDKEADVVAKLRSTGELQKRVPELEKLAEVAEEGLDLGNRFVGSYARLHPIERDWFRKIVPFYTFTKAMTLLAARLPFLYPGRTFMWHHFADMVNDAVRDESAPAWVQQYIPIMAGQDGSIWMARLSSANPFGGVKVGSIGEENIPGILDVARQNPLMKLYFDLSGATPSWSKKPLSPGEYATRMDNGEVYKFTGTGFKRVIPQASAWKALWNLFPQSQMIDSWFSPYVQTDRGWIGFQDPIRRANGEIMFPREAVERYLSFIQPIRKISIEEEKSKEKRRVIRVVKSFRDDIRRLPPEQREQFISVLRQWASGKLHPSLEE